MSSEEFVDEAAVMAILDDIDALDKRLADMPLHALNATALLNAHHPTSTGGTSRLRGTAKHESTTTTTPKTLLMPEQHDDEDDD
jgi:hypothetical protein